MTQTGIPTNDNAITTFRHCFLKGEHKFVTFLIKDGSIQVEHTGSSLEELVQGLPSNECRYAVYRANYTVPSEIQGIADSQRSKSVMILWAPSTANIRNKFVYSATRIPFGNRLGFSGLGIQTSDVNQLSEEEILGKCKAFFKH